MEGNDSEHGSPSKQSEQDEPQHRQKSTGLKNLIQPKRRLNLSISKRQQATQLEKQVEEEADETEIIDTCYAHVVKEFEDRSEEALGDEEESDVDNDDDESEYNEKTPGRSPESVGS